MAVLTGVNQVTLGNALMITVEGNIIGGATSHSLSVSPEYTEVQCKEAGQTPWKVLTKVGWECTCDALYTSDYATLLSYATGDQEVEIIFGSIPAADAKSGFSTEPTVTGIGAFGTAKKAKISSLQLTASSGDNATVSVTFTGTESLYTAPSGS